MSMINREWLAEVAKGAVPGFSLVHKFGEGSAVGTTPVPLTQGKVYRTPQAASATTLRIKAGGNANNTAAGTGARAIFLEGLDATGAVITETLATAGASASASTSQSFMRLYRAYVSASGTYATPNSLSTGSMPVPSTIVIENTAGTEDWLTISASTVPNAQSEVGCYTVPLGKTAYLLDFALTVDSAKSASIWLFKRNNILQSAAPYEAMRVVKEYEGVSGSLDRVFRAPERFDALTDIIWAGKFPSSTGEISVEFTLLLEDS